MRIFNACKSLYILGYFLSPAEILLIACKKINNQKSKQTIYVSQANALAHICVFSINKVVDAVETHYGGRRLATMISDGCNMLRYRH